MWLILAFTSACLLGLYDVFKKRSLDDNAVIPVLLLNCFFSSIIFLPFIICSAKGIISDDSLFYTHPFEWEQQKYILLKAVIVLSSWIFAYFGLKHLPITIVGPINATRPVMVLIGALTLFGEKLNFWQWIGVAIAVISFFLLSKSGKKEGINFKKDIWIFFVVMSNILGAISGLYDRFLLAPIEHGGIALDKMAVQSWNNIYQFGIMLFMLIFLWWPTHKKTTPFRWDWCIILISLALAGADFVYFYALGFGGAMISIVSMIRRGSVVVSFLFGAMVFREKNLKAKAFDIALVILSMVFLYIGSK